MITLLCSAGLLSARSASEQGGSTERNSLNLITRRRYLVCSKLVYGRTSYNLVDDVLLSAVEGIEVPRLRLYEPPWVHGLRG